LSLFAKTPKRGSTLTTPSAPRIGWFFSICYRKDEDLAVIAEGRGFYREYGQYFGTGSKEVFERSLTHTRASLVAGWGFCLGFTQGGLLNATSESTLFAKVQAMAIGGYVPIPKTTSLLQYWPLQQKKLGKSGFAYYKGRWL
jgi:hypothetical protein